MQWVSVLQTLLVQHYGEFTLILEHDIGIVRLGLPQGTEEGRLISCIESVHVQVGIDEVRHLRIRIGAHKLFQ